MNSLNAENIRSRLTRSLPELDRRILVKEAQSLSLRLASMEGPLLSRITMLLSANAETRFRLYSQFQELLLALPKLRTEKEKNRLMLDFLAESVPGSSLRDDRKAFDRWLDLTGVRERARVAMHESDRLTEMLLHLLSDCLIETFAAIPINDVAPEWTRADVSHHLENELNDSPRWQNHVTVLKVWENICRSLPEEKWRQMWSESWDRRVKNLLSSPEENIWLQTQAFKLSVVVESSHALAIIHHRLTSPAASRDDVFLRACLLEIVARSYPIQELSRLVQEAFRRPDPSEHVLITAARRISGIPMPESILLLSGILASGANPGFSDKVRAAAAFSLEEIIVSELSISAQMVGDLQKIYESALAGTAGIRLHLALVEGLGKAALTHAEREPGNAIDPFDYWVLQNLDQVIGNEKYPEKVRRIASEIREMVILNRDPAARSLFDTIMTTGHSLNPGESFLLSAEMVPDETLLGRVLARISVHDYGYYAQRESHGYRIWRGEIFKRRFWRFLHELNHPDPAKRQGYVHTIGRCYQGLIRAHARYMAETTETKVPGERLFFRKEYSWRPFIPTVDDMLSATRSKNAGKTIRIFSSEGVFSMTGPRDMSERFSLWWYITLNYETLVQKRNYDLEDVQSGHNRNFTQILQEDFGFNIEFHPHAYTYQGKIHQVIDPHLAIHMFPLIRTQLEWRPLS